jgi:hypothetical protein
MQCALPILRIAIMTTPARALHALFLLTFMAAGSGGCFPDRQAVFAEKGELDSVKTVRAPARVYLSDATVALFPNGFDVTKDTLTGMAHVYNTTAMPMEGDISRLPVKTVRTPLANVIAMTYYNDKITIGRGLASFFYGLTSAVMVPAAISCLADPKSCFGSCPTIYTADNAGWDFEAELFSYSVSRLMEANDIDLLHHHMPHGGQLTIRVANEALETHYIDRMELVAARHPYGTRVFPTPTGEIIGVKEPTSPVSAVNSAGASALNTIGALDGKGYRSDTALVRRALSGATADWLEMSFDAPVGRTSAVLLLRLKNTLLSTVLFYNVVLGSQGAGAIEWTQRMNTDPAYAALFSTVYREFSGVRIQVRQGDTWKQEAVIADVGPVGWKEVAVRIPVTGSGPMRVRLQFFPDNIEFDYAGCDFSDPADVPMTMEPVSPREITDQTRSSRPDIVALLQNPDNTYLCTEPGHAYRITYDVPDPGTMDLTLLLRSRGYYTEWVRGAWVREAGTVPAFDLMRIDRSIEVLCDSWLRNRTRMESMFFRTRIPITEGL